MADAVLSVEVRAKLERLSKGLKEAEKSIEDFVGTGDRHISKIEARFASLGKSTKEISDNIKSALGGMSFEKFFKDVAGGKDIVSQTKIEVAKYKEEIERLMTSSLKTGAFKNREFVYELLILNGRNIHEKIKVYRSTDRLCHQAGRDRYTHRGSVPQNGNQ